MEINQDNREDVEVLVLVPTEEALKDLREAFEPFRQAFKVVLERIVIFIREKWEFLKEVTVKWYQLEEEKQIVVRQHHHRDFSRQKITHQVIDRKPRQFIRKIIR